MNTNFDVFITHDGSVAKYIHEDGSETAIKLVKPVQSIINPITGAVEDVSSTRNKYTVFVSSSVGCFMKCKFCHLTIKNADFEKISQEVVLENLKQAISDMAKRTPDLATKYIKLSWMGMGDALNKPDMVTYVTISLLDWVLTNKYAKGLDGVDLSTVFPKIKNHAWIKSFIALNSYLKKYPRNPSYAMDNVQYTNNRYSSRPPFRLFYSIESACQKTRDSLIPNAMSLQDAKEALKSYLAASPEAIVIFHHMLIEGQNDSDIELDLLQNFIAADFPQNELRLLRYNFCAKSPLKESDLFLKQVKKLSSTIPFLKVQVSPGSEVSAACGQFIVKMFK